MCLLQYLYRYHYLWKVLFLPIVNFCNLAFQIVAQKCLIKHWHTSSDKNSWDTSTCMPMLDRAYHLSLTWFYFSEECERLSLCFHV